MRYYMLYEVWGCWNDPGDEGNDTDDKQHRSDETIPSGGRHRWYEIVPYSILAVGQAFSLMKLCSMTSDRDTASEIPIYRLCSLQV